MRSSLNSGRVSTVEDTAKMAVLLVFPIAYYRVSYCPVCYPQVPIIFLQVPSFGPYSLPAVSRMNPTDTILAELRDQRSLLLQESELLHAQAEIKSDCAADIDRMIQRLEFGLVAGTPNRTIPSEPA